MNAKMFEEYDKYIIASSTDTKGIITYVSQAFCDISGYTSQELIGKSHSIVRHPDTPQEVFSELWETLHANKAWKGEIKNKTKDGNYYWVEATVSPLFENDILIGYSSVRKDITSTKFLGEHDEIITTLFDSLHDIVVLTDGIQIRFVNKAFLRFTGYKTLEDFRADYRCICDMFDTEDLRYLQQMMDDVPWTQYVVEHPDDVHQAKIIKDGKEHLLGVDVHDVVMQGSNFYLAVLSESLVIKNLNATLQEQIDKKEIVLHDLKRSQNKVVEQEKMVALGQLIAGVAHEVNTPLGAMKSSSGSILESMTLLLDNLPNLFTSLEHKDKDLFFDFLDMIAKQKDILSTRDERKVKRSLAKELENENIIDSIFITDRLIDMKCYKDVSKYYPLFKHKHRKLIVETAYNVSDLQFNVYNINEAIKRASKIIFALKSFARYDYSGDPVKANLVQGVDTALTIYANKIKKGVTIVTSYEEVPDVLCYVDELNQVWTNLVFNAIQAMNYSGTLTLDIRQKDDFIMVSITDTGCGIPDKIKDKIFEPFFTTKPSGEGSGLGLDIVKKIIDKHHGKIELETEENVGSTFKIYIPVALEETNNV
ncbi:PAS domain S-box protein [Sulfurimonas sp. SAG-AH-194-I05]|nr:PAS domain-containing sensor histidine kinase [Sulfurimonas sp. SAG-AH-194-I05]MDF1875719.1 PAS domain S-box protein [Sulfurimonas sp. SAG-AH-194-I05]